MFQSSFLSSPAIWRVTLLSTSVKSCTRQSCRWNVGTVNSCQARPLTETKKLVVPSSRSNVPGNNFSQVSSPYMTNFPVPFAFIWASQVSWDARVEDSSPSFRLRTTSRKDGTDPVVMALRRGIVTVGEVACAVKGIATPSRIKLELYVSAGQGNGRGRDGLTTGRIQSHCSASTQSH